MTSSTFDRRTQAFIALLVLVVILLLALSSSQHTGGRTGRTTLEVGAAEPLLLEGSLDPPLRPGAIHPLDLTVTNLYDRTVVLTDLTVTVTVVDAPHATSTRPCTVADFRASPSRLDRLDRLVLGPRATTTLQSAGIDPDRWPSVTMIDTDQNQDGCRRASLALSLRAIGDFT